MRLNSPLKGILRPSIAMPEAVRRGGVKLKAGTSPVVTQALETTVRRGELPPPYNPDYLWELTTKSVYHEASIDLIASDVIADGPRFRTSESKRDDAAHTWWENLAPSPGNPTTEVLRAAWRDYQVYAYCAFELEYAGSGNRRRLVSIYYIPARYTRLLSNGKVRVGANLRKRVVFSKWPEVENNRSVMFICRTGGHSQYGLGPRYVSAIPAIEMTDRLYRDDMDYFDKDREPKSVTLFPDGDDVDDLIEMLNTEVEPGEHGSVYAKYSGPEPKIAHIKLQEDKDQKTMEKLEKLGDEITTLWRIPPGRVGKAVSGLLAGNASESLNRVYKESIVDREQGMVIHFLNRLLIQEWTNQFNSPPQWTLSLKVLDLTDMKTDSDVAVSEFRRGLKYLNEARAFVGDEEVPEDRGEGTIPNIGRMFAPEIDAYLQNQSDDTGPTPPDPRNDPNNPTTN